MLQSLSGFAFSTLTTGAFSFKKMQIKPFLVHILKTGSEKLMETAVIRLNIPWFTPKFVC